MEIGYHYILNAEITQQQVNWHNLRGGEIEPTPRSEPELMMQRGNTLYHYNPDFPHTYKAANPTQLQQNYS